MIDNLEKTNLLIAEMKASLPISVVITPELLKLVRNNDVESSVTPDCKIVAIHYLGDEGGIGCGLELSIGSKVHFIVSLTHIRISKQHKLAKKIISYQKKRLSKLSRYNR